MILVNENISLILWFIKYPLWWFKNYPFQQTKYTLNSKSTLVTSLIQLIRQSYSWIWTGTIRGARFTKLEALLWKQGCFHSIQSLLASEHYHYVDFYTAW